MKILIVEDNMILKVMIEKWLQKAGYEVLTAIDEPGARSILKKHEISLVLGDVRLPEGNGISLLEWMMHCGMEIPFIVMTDYACISDVLYVQSSWELRIIWKNLSIRNNFLN